MLMKDRCAVESGTGDTEFEGVERELATKLRDEGQGAVSNRGT